MGENAETPQRDLERAGVYLPIPGGPQPPTARPRPSKKLLLSSLAAVSLLAALLLIVSVRSSAGEVPEVDDGVKPSESITAPSRGVAQGVSEKVHRRVGGGELSFSWSNAMLTWQRTAFHFQPPNNWMNDPNAPLFHMGWYHLFYQYNPESAVWGNITWGHAVSKDLIKWFHLPYAMVPDQWYDVNGVWTGSATILPGGKIVILYTGDTADVVQVQCLAYPQNQSDPLLLHWAKDTANPVLVPPPGIGRKDFRDPTTAWLGPSGDRWRITIGSKDANKTGIALVYETGDFVNFELLEGYLHEVPGTGMWECIDFYPVSLTGVNGLDTSVNGPGIKHVMKASLDDDKNDYYAIGSYDPVGNRWTPDDPTLDVGIGLRYDYGKFYASKTFYDQNKKRRVLWGWITETDAESLDMLKGWSGVQAIPRTITLDRKTGSNLIQWPVEEVESLRLDSVEFESSLGPGSLVPIKLGSASQLDILASFSVEDKDEALEKAASEADGIFDCAKSVGAVNRGVLGPFGIVVLADEKLTESTPIYFYITKGADGKAETHFCADELRSSRALDVDKIVYGSKVPVLDGENLTIRSLVDHSIVESFAQGGRTVITSRVYPTKAIGSAARVFLFNNATTVTVKASIKIWKMASADIRQFPLDQI